MQAEAALHSAELTVKSAQVTYDNVRQSEMHGIASTLAHLRTAEVAIAQAEVFPSLELPRKVAGSRAIGGQIAYTMTVTPDQWDGRIRWHDRYSRYCALTYLACLAPLAARAEVLGQPPCICGAYVGLQRHASAIYRAHTDFSIGVVPSDASSLLSVG